MVTITRTSRIAKLEQPIKGILFDKDGTLIHFHSIWLPIAKSLVKQFAKAYLNHGDDICDQLEKLIGLEGERVDGNGILAGGTTHDIANTFYRFMLEAGYHQYKLDEIYVWLSEKMVEITRENSQYIEPTGNLIEMLNVLKAKNIEVGIATADDLETTKICLTKLGLTRYFSFVITADTHGFSKPHRSIIEKFCERTGLQSNEVAVVGDTNVDLALAHNGRAGLAIGVLSGASRSEELEELADLIVPAATDIVNEDGVFIWEN
ncbi:HAD family hydrolase [Alkalihalobacterium sp. APHAB7]|uniref:HAD family hydrolase n=1 Tax=Alkalihalobacterium sp. APHAB7 TaxID=3402081 RepID=UPI003AAD67A9